jgi:cbb3-type cytochrome oxidase subunit 1
VDSMNNWALKFIRWGMGLTVLGLVTGYFPLAHYLMLGAIPSCPSAPVHGHTVLLSFVGMTMFGLAYRMLPGWMEGEPPLRLVGLHFWLAAVGVIGVCVNGTIGYELLGLLQPDFYYNGAAAQTVRNAWFAIDGVFLTVYGSGCIIFLYIVMKKTSYAAARMAV